MSYTFATLPISKEAYEEIKQRLLAAGATYAIYKTGLTGEVLDMRGIALVIETERDKEIHCVLCDIIITEKESQTTSTNVCYNCATTKRSDRI